MKRNITYTLYLALFWLKLRYSAIEYDTVVVFVRVSVYAYVYMLAAEYNLTKVNSMLLYIHLVTSAAILSLSLALFLVFTLLGDVCIALSTLEKLWQQQQQLQHMRYAPQCAMICVRIRFNKCALIQVNFGWKGPLSIVVSYVKQLNENAALRITFVWKKIQEILVFDEVRSKFTNLIEKFEKICYPLDLNRLIFFSIQVIFDAQEIFNTFTKLLLIQTDVAEFIQIVVTKPLPNLKYTSILFNDT